ncbi:protein kinase [Nocardia sp. NBC_01503]|uniref:serine/threonine-protein kinase n=1 Tax=Nocardia sp. NBC_01503 TaxID=2975997 RepID=UPI002E7B2B0B|nr:protein kinase [Nocardia sp. NBC_01503]WTL34047.1 protein kinase [Nocardia sp. NBC_01503]
MLGDGTLGHYRLVMLLGQGGMGQVWAAHDTRIGRDVALKVLPVELASDPDYRRRFEREAQLAARLRGPHIVPIHTFGELDGRLFIDMELVDGTDLADVLAHRGPLTPARAVDLVAQIAEALDVAHEAGLIHRDVKPSNVVVLPGGFAYLIDFGLAREVGQTALTSTGVTIGTWAYMAPERFSGVDDLRSDIYSLACLLFECLTGKRPFGDKDAAQQMLAHMSAPPPCASAIAPAVPAALDVVISLGMAKNPTHRPASAGMFAEAARGALVASTAPRHAPAPMLAPGAQRQTPGTQTRASAPHGPWPAAQSLPQPSHPPAAHSYPRGGPGYRPGLRRPLPMAQGYSPIGGRAMPSMPPLGVQLSYPQTAHGDLRRDGSPVLRPPITAWRVVWWIVLGLCTTFFGFLSLVCIFGLISDTKMALAGRIAINVVMDVPTTLFVWLAVLEFRKFRRR